MTVVRVFSDEGRLDDGLRSELAEALTAAVLEVEVGRDAPLARPGVMVLFNDVPPGRWAVGGRLDDTYVAAGGRLLVTASAMEGVWTAERRRALIKRFSRAIGKALGMEGERGALGTCWVLFDEIAEGSWGAFGGPLSLLAILEPAGFTPDRVADARRRLEGRGGAPDT